MAIKTSEFQFEYKKHTFTCKCTFKTGIKRYNFRIRNQQLLVTAPYFTSQYNLKTTIQDHLSHKFLDHLLVEEKKIEEDITSTYILGSKYELESFNKDELLFNYDFSFTSKEEFDKKLKRFALNIFTERVRKYEQIMGIKEPYRVTCKDMKTRYGTNSRKTHTICLSLQLIHYNIDIIDSVVVHELAHHYYFDHSSNFYSVVYKYCPSYNKLKAMLRKGVYL